MMGSGGQMTKADVRSRLRSAALGLVGVAFLPMVPACGGSEEAAGAVGIPVYEVDEMPVMQLGDKRKGQCKDDNTDCYYIDTATAKDPDWSCLGKWEWPTPGDSKTYKVRLEDFTQYTPTVGACVNVYLDNVVPENDTCTEDYITAEDGTFTFDAPEESVISYRVFAEEGAGADDTIADSVEVNFMLSTVGDTSAAVSVSLGTLNFIPQLLQIRRAVDTGLIGASVRDCNGDPVYGARVLAYTLDGELLPEGTSAEATHYRFFDGTSFPSAKQPWTQVDGLVGVINVPTDEDAYLLAVYGRRKKGGKVELIGCERMTLLPNGLTLASVQPLRGSSPTCPDSPPEGW